MGAIELHARPSPDYEAKLARTRALLVKAAADHQPLVQASSLGAEDMVITHLVQGLELDIPVFVLDTGLLHPQTLEMYLRQSHAARTHELSDRLGSVTSPTHVICGEEDIFTPPRYSVDIANAIPGARLTVMPEVGHGMFWEATDDFNRTVLEFIDQHPLKG